MTLVLTPLPFILYLSYPDCFPKCLPGLPPCTTRSDVTSGLEAADCGCRDSEVAYNGLCAGLFTEAACPQGKLLLPMYFTVGEKSCPETFECVALDMCPNYRVTKGIFQNNSLPRILFLAKLYFNMKKFRTLRILHYFEEPPFRLI